MMLTPIFTAVATAGFCYACTVAELVTTSGDNLLTLPRLTVNAGIGIAGLARLLDGRPQAGGREMAAVKRIARRALRRLTPAVGGNPREGRSAT